MAEIPVERKSGVPWWVWLLGALLLLALLALMMRGCNDATTNENANTNAANANAGNTNSRAANRNGVAANNANSNAANLSGANVTDINLFGDTTDKQALVGRRVELQNVRVARVLSDHVFTVTSGGEEMFVLLDENLDTGGGKEQQIKARAGQRVNLVGTFRNVPNAETSEERRGRGLNANEYRQMTNQRVYLHATEARNA